MPSNPEQLARRYALRVIFTYLNGMKGRVPDPFAPYMSHSIDRYLQPFIGRGKMPEQSAVEMLGEKAVKAVCQFNASTIIGASDYLYHYFNEHARNVDLLLAGVKPKDIPATKRWERRAGQAYEALWQGAP